MPRFASSVLPFMHKRNKNKLTLMVSQRCTVHRGRHGPPDEMMRPALMRLWLAADAVHWWPQVRAPLDDYP